MPETSFQRKIFALITVLVTVHAFVFYNIYVINGRTLMEFTCADSVLGAVNDMGGVYMFGAYLPIWAVVLIEFICAFCLEIFVGQRFSFYFACKNFDPKTTHPVLFETAVICATVGIMCPSMSFLASFFYFPYYGDFTFIGWLASWMRLICFNFPFALLNSIVLYTAFCKKSIQVYKAKDIKENNLNLSSGILIVKV